MKATKLTFLALCIFIYSLSYSQVTTGELQGVITDTTGNPISLTEISISGPTLIGNIGAVSNENGYFKIRAIPPGPYKMEIRHLSFQVLIIENVDVMLGRTLDMGQVTLNPGSIDLEEAVIVWTRPALDPASTSLGSYIDAQILNSLPIERDYKSVLTLIPQANSSFHGDNTNIFGASGSDNVYFIDGMNVTDPYGASGGLTMPFNFIKGIDVKQGGYEAEFGKATGGIINVVTPSGSNEFEASAFGYFTGDALTPKQKRDTLSTRDIKDFANYDFGLSFGGPIVKDKLWYYLAYNSIFENQDIQVPGYEIMKDKRTIHAYAVKLNWIAFNNTRFMLSLIGNQSIHNQVGVGSGITAVPSADLRNIDPVLSNFTDKALNLALDVKKNTRSGVLLSGSLAYSNWNNMEEGQTEIGKTEPFYRDFVEDYIEGGYGWIQDMNSQRIILKISGEWGWKQHNFKGGIETEVMLLDQLTDCTDLGWVFRAGDSYYESWVYEIDDKGANIIPGLFVQDSWQLFRNIRLNYGLRWDAQFFRGPYKSHNINITDQLQPRIGVIYNAGNSIKYKLTAHFARYYTQYPLFTVLDKILPYNNLGLAYLADPRVPGTEPVDTVFNVPGDKPGTIIDPGRIRGEFSDEFVAGFEMLLVPKLKLGIKGVYRHLKNGFGFYVPHGDSLIIGNPGSGMLETLPSYNRKYAALVFSLGTYQTSRFIFFTSYVLSLNKGNYTGFFDQDHAQINLPGNYMGLQLPEQVPNSYGYMPNDRRHVFKLNASYRFRFGLTAGTSFWLMSGTPLNEFGTSWFPNRYIFLVERGTAGRLPTLWDLNLRLTYDFDIASVHGKIFLDALHVGSPMETVKVDELRYLDVEMTNPNEKYGKVLQYQPPMMIRWGLNIDI
jgi:hypothetical protein